MASHRIADEKESRRFLRHPTTVNTTCRIKEHPENVAVRELRNISFGGMAFVSDTAQRPGDVVEITFPVLRSDVPIQGEIIWSAQVEAEGEGQFINGLRFLDHDAFFRARLTEQMCHIEAYRAAQEESGRKISSDEAALEWAEKNAEDFPNL